ncbi:MAG: hypothetical protein JKX85_07620 [Phycisphaeraceae bacterium]|nr:hypothetical protein [Phycisphaeraceae bacterium]
MKKIYRSLFVIVALHALSISFLLQARAGSPEALPELKTSEIPQWENLKDIDIAPCPKKITVDDASITIDENLAIVIGKLSSERTKIAALDLQDIIKEQTSVVVPVMVDGEETGYKNLIVLGLPSEMPRIEQYCKSAQISLDDVEKQGYAIFPIAQDGKQNIILAGKDEQGVYWSAMTLSHLIKNKTIRIARIIDWPDFKNRLCATLHAPMRSLFSAKSKKQKKVAWVLVKKAIRRAARLKYNQIKCFAVLYSTPKTDYLLDNRATMLGKVGEYANKRGLKLHLNFTTAVATEGDEKKFPQLKECLKFLHLYVSWSDEQLINHACDKITKMVKIIGPQHYFLHSPDIPYMGWNRRSDNDRKRWQDDRVSAETYLTNKICSAIKRGNPNAQVSYVSTSYAMTGSEEQIKNTEDLCRKLSEDIMLVWREGPAEAAKKLRAATKNRPQEYYIENSSTHKNRLLGGTSRTAKTYYFNNSDNDKFRGGGDTSFRIAHQPELGLLAEYMWNTQAPGAVFVNQSKKEKDKSKWHRMTVNGMPWGEWLSVHDLDGPLRNELIPRVCRQYFGEKVGNTLALAYSVGSSINDNALGGLATIPYDRRYENSLVFAQRLAHANTQMAKLWGKQDQFNPGTYRVYLIAFKYVNIYQHIEKVNAYLMRLSWIAQTGQDEDQVLALTDEALACIQKVRKDLADGYEKYNLQSIRYAAIYGAKIGKLDNVYKKIDNLENAINFKNKQIKMFGAGKISKEKKAPTIGIVPVTAAVTLDGKLDEWDMDSAYILDKSLYNRKLGTQGITGPRDVIAYWKASWDKSYLYVAVQIFDDNLSFEKYSPLFRNDAVELWVNKQQFVFSINPDGKAAVEPYGNYDSKKITMATRRGEKPHHLHPGMKYWNLELKIQADCLETAAKIGNSFYMALGVDDVDPNEKPTQLFFPDTYQHLNMTPGASYTKDFVRVVLQSKTEFTTTLSSSGIANVAKADGTYTCVNLELALTSKEKTVGISSEVFLYTKEGIRRFKVDIPEVLQGDWKKTLQIVTDDLYASDIGIDLIIRAPGYYQKFELQKGEYRHTALGYIPSNDSNNIVEEEPKPLLGTSFDNGTFEIQTSNGNAVAPVASADCTIVDARKGKAAKIETNGYLAYKLPKPQLINKGMIEFWIKPEYSINDKKTRAFINLASSNSGIRFIKNQSYSYMFIIYERGKINNVHVKTNKIKTGAWNYIALKWDDVKKSMLLNINGVETTKDNLKFDLNKPFRSLVVGNIKRGGEQDCNSIIDELKIKNTH